MYRRIDGRGTNVWLLMSGYLGTSDLELTAPDFDLCLKSQPDMQCKSDRVAVLDTNSGMR